MFLSALNKSESMAFINLISEFAVADKKLCLEEKALIEEACEEMGVPDDGLEPMEFEDALAIFKKSTGKVKDIVYFELTRCGLVDENYDMEEVEFLNKISDELNIARATRFAMAGYFFKYTDTDRLNSEQAKSDAEAIINHRR